MSLQLARASVRLSFRLMSTRQLSSMSPRIIIAQNQLKSLNLFSQNVNLIAKQGQTQTRAYASHEKLDKSQVEEKVLDIIRNFDRVKENPAKPQTFNNNKVALESNLMKDLGLDSLDQVEIIVQLEDTFGYEIPDSDYEKLNTPAEIVNYIQKRLAEV